MAKRDIIVIGASAGGVETLRELVKTLPVGLPASIFIVLHISSRSPSLLASILNRARKLPVVTASDGDEIEHSKIYVAPSDRHLLVERDRVRVVRGPKENRHRPAIDPLFRSAASSFGSRVIGVVLSGTLDDGSAGLSSIKKCGGIAIVQDPNDALYPEMPLNALRTVEADYCLSLERISPILDQLVHEPAPESPRPPDHLRTEIGFAMMQNDMKDMDKLGTPSPFTCPACHGTLWEVREEELIRYRCHLGHAYSPESLLDEQSEVIENALDSAVRALREKAATSRRLADRFCQSHPTIATEYVSKADALDEEAEVIRGLLTGREV